MGKNSKAKPTKGENRVSVQRPKKSLQRKMLTGAAFIAIAPTVICIAVFSFMMRDRIVDQHSQDGRTMSEMLALSLSGRVGHGWSRAQGEMIDSVSKDPRVSFVTVYDVKGRMLHAGIFHNPVWDHFQKAHPKLQRPLKQGQKGSTIIDEGTIAYRIPIFVEREHRPETTRKVNVSPINSKPGGKRPHGKAGGRPGHDGPEPSTMPLPPVEGTLVFAMQQPSIQKSMQEFHATQMLIVLVAVLLFLPIVSLFFRKWRKPLLELVTATRQLAEGKPPTPIKVASQDELSFLASSFNDMADKIKTQRSELVEANETLEAKVRDRTKQLSEAMMELDRVASTDALTGVANRRAFTEALEDHFAASKRVDDHLACVMIDLDGFKRVNDTLGHKTGDELLALAATVMRENCRSTDMVARLGGDEFVLLMPFADTETATATAELILERFKQASAELLNCDDVATKVSFSLGMSSLQDHAATSAEILLDQADKALYVAKENGKAQLRIFDGKLAA